MVSFTSWARRLAGGLTLLLVAASAQAAGLMTPTEGGVPPLELREQHVTVDVEGTERQVEQAVWDRASIKISTILL